MKSSLTYIIESYYRLAKHYRCAEVTGRSNNGSRIMPMWTSTQDLDKYLHARNTGRQSVQRDILIRFGDSRWHYTPRIIRVTRNIERDEYNGNTKGRDVRCAYKSVGRKGCCEFGWSDAARRCNHYRNRISGLSRSSSADYFEIISINGTSRRAVAVRLNVLDWQSLFLTYD